MSRCSLPMATTATSPLAANMSNHGILLPLRPSNSSSPSNSPDVSSTSTSTSSSHTSLTDLASHSSISTSKQTAYSSARNPASPRRIRFAPLPDPRRAVLITDDGDEVYIPVPDENVFSTSLLLPHSPLAMSMTISSAPAEACDLDPPPLLNDDGAATSSSSSTNESYLSSNSSSSASTTSNPRTATPSEYSPMSSVGSSPVIRDTTALPPIGKSASAPAPPSAWLKPPRSLNPFRRSTASLSGSSSHSLTPTSSIDNSAPTRSPSPPNANGKSFGLLRPPRKVLSLSTEEILTLGTINLFRTSSRDSTASSSTATSSWAFNKRWSGSSVSSSTNTNGSPLVKTQSSQSSKTKSRFSLGGSGSSTSSLSSGSADAKSTAAKPKPPPSKPFNRHKGTRMLNGRVYGSKHTAALAANPFATARDEEPQFVEWGYGGMGSVKGATSAGVASGGVNWERLHGGAAVKEGVGVGTTEEEDDGSGMGWVKKRKEERERKERERLAALEAEKEQGPEHSESNLSTPTPTRTSTMDGVKSTPVEDSNNAATVSISVLDEAVTDEPGVISPSLESAATIVPSSYPSSGHPVEEADGEVGSSVTQNGLLVPSKSKESLKENVEENSNSEKDAVSNSEAPQPQEHAPDIVPVPAWLHHSGSYHRKHGHARTPSYTGSMPTPSSVEGVNGDVMRIAENISASASKAENHSDENDASSSSASSASSDSEDEELGEDEDEEDEEEDEEEKARHEARRKTALGAGVEKVMRHKE